MLIRGLSWHQLVKLMLRKKSDPQLARFADFPFHRGQPVSNQLRQSGFTLAICAEQGDAIIAIKSEIDPPQHSFAVIADCSLFDHHQWRWQRFRRRKLKFGNRIFRQRGDGLHFFKLFQTGLSLTRLGRLVTEPVDKRLDMGTLRILFLFHRHLLFQLQAPFGVKLVIATAIIAEL